MDDVPLYQQPTEPEHIPAIRRKMREVAVKQAAKRRAANKRYMRRALPNVLASHNSLKAQATRNKRQG